MNMEELVQTYIQVRGKKSQLKAQYEAQVAKYDALQDKIEALLMQRFSEMGIDSIKTPAGTAYTSVTCSASVADWDTFKEFLDRQEHPYDFVEHRVSKAAVEQYKAANDDLPPGVNWSEIRKINFRKATTN